jgi:hypothetical protein
LNDAPSRRDQAETEKFAMTDPATKPMRPPTPLALKIGLGLLVTSLVWWFLYYSHYYGAFGLMDLKLACINGATSECLFFQQQIKDTILPTYSPILWYAGLVVGVIGLVQQYKARKAAP